MNSRIEPTRGNGYPTLSVRSLPLLLGLLATFVSTGAQAAVGRTQGAFAVTDTGAATYSIPIRVPPGANGMQPSLAIAYDSRSDNGPLGVGWTLSGLSGVARCKKTLAQDSSTDSAAWQTADRYCLDGTKLRLTSASGTYGLAGSTYQTEVDEYSRITAVGTSTSGRGPDHWTAQGRNGLTYEFGNSAESRDFVSGPSIWDLNKVTDRAGNYMTIQYANGTWLLPLTITYATNDGMFTGGASSVQFQWTIRPTTDLVTATTVSGAVGGPQRDTLLLHEIDVFESGSLIRVYKLTYTNTGSNGRSRLSTVQECDGAGACLTATQISWQNGAVGFGTNTTITNLGSLGGFALPIDLNNDGRTDVVYPSGSNWAYMLANSSGGYGTAHVTTTPHNGKYAGALLVDYFGNGKQEILVPNASGNWSLLQFNGSGFTSTTLTAGGSPIPAAAQSWLGDVNGDGYPDLVFVSPSSTQLLCRFNSASGFSSTVSTLYTAPAGTTIYLYTTTMSFNTQNTLNQGDFNHDGRTDLLVGFVGTTPKMLLSTGTSYVDSGVVFPDTSGSSIVGTTWRPLDANGDGVDDLAFVDSSGVWKVLYGVPTAVGSTSFVGPVTSSITSPATAGGTAVLPLDWDGDHRVDILAAPTSPSPGGHWFLLHATGDTLSTSQSGTGAFSGATATDTGILTNQMATMVVDVNGDGLPDLMYVDTSQNLHVLLHNGPMADLVNSVVDGFGNSAQITYAPLTDSTVYTEGTGAVYPMQDLLVPLYVVKQSTLSDGIGGTYSLTESYKTARTDVKGRGFLGFGSRTEVDSRTGVSTIWTYRQDFPFAGSVDTVVVSQPSSGPTIAKTTNTWTSVVLDSTSNNQRYAAELTGISDLHYEVGGTKNGLLIDTLSRSYAYDNFGNATTETSTRTDNDSTSPYVGNSWTRTVTNTPSVDQVNWCLPLLTAVQDVFTATDGSTSVTRTKSFTPDTVKCRYNEIVTEPSSATYKVTEDFTYDGFGNLATDKVTGVGMAARNTILNWGATGRYRMSVTEPSGAQTLYNYNFAYGLRTSTTDPNGVPTSWVYDTFGRQSQESRPDGTYTMWTYADCAPSNCVTGSHGLVLTQTVYGVGGGVISDETAYSDTLDRTLIATQRLLGSGTYDRHDVRYDTLGRVSQQSAVCVWTAVLTPCPYWTTNHYDLLNRITSTQRPISATNPTLQTISFTYAGRTTTTTDPLSVSTSVVKDVNGRLRKATDAYAYTVTLGYDAAGAHSGTTDSLGNTLWSGTYQYGTEPFLMSSSDMDLGSRTYTVDALGERTHWTDALGQNFSETYDSLSRPLIRTEPDLYTQWTYGTSSASHNIGKLQSVCVDDPPSCGSTAYVESNTYDSLGRPSQKSINSLIFSGYNTYTYTQQYNATTGQLDTLTYPTSTSAFALKLKYAYQNGLLQSITDIANTPNVVLWTANTTNAARQLTKETLGNGIVTNRAFDDVTHLMQSVTSGVGGGSAVKNLAFLYDQDGNATERQDNNLGLTEDFYYDNDYRLSYSKLNAAQNLGLGYDVMGNISSRTDIASGANWTYDTVHKHQVKQAGSSAYQYTYDANGNALTLRGNSALWWSFNYPECIPASCGGTGEGVVLIYGQDRQRIQQIYNNGSTQEWTNYLGPLEIISTSSGNDFRHYIYANGEPVALYSRKSTGVNTYYYVLSDNQRSVTGITSSTGTVIVGENFGAFGDRRNPTTWSGPPTSGDLNTIAGITREGYTFQTALGLSMHLNHMNGRVQDALTGRFLSADPNVPDPANTQSFNRYSYVTNNPMSYTDPTGFFSLSDLLNPFSDDNPLNPFGHVGRTLAFAPFTLADFGRRQGDSLLRHNTWLQPIVQIAACYFGQALGCAAADAYLVRLNGGSIQQALIGGALTFASSYAYGWVDDNVDNWAELALAHGAIGGGVASLTGGSFKQGFYLAGGASLLDSLYLHATDHQPGWGPGEDRPGTGANADAPGSNWYTPAPDYSVPESYWDVNTFGFNGKLVGDGSWGDCFTQSGACSQFLDKVPGLQGVSQLHDFVQNWAMANGLGGINFLTMLPAAGVTYGALLDQYYVAPTFLMRRK